MLNQQLRLMIAFKVVIISRELSQLQRSIISRCWEIPSGLKLALKVRAKSGRLSELHGLGLGFERGWRQLHGVVVNSRGLKLAQGLVRSTAKSKLQGELELAPECFESALIGLELAPMGWSQVSSRMVGLAPEVGVSSAVR